ncbi:hypothetical protein BKA64DRAFT_644834 [Cadophora sp. MPI-SDFR-AT-0126]|nr:hypothetical protein BKA64DRAFT_644834 [Leotiomycetes sp. MPI-SDFR-AT-0126]
MFHKLKQKASLARVNILGDTNAPTNTNNNSDSLPRRKSRPLQPINERPSPIYTPSDLHSPSTTSVQASQVETLRNELSQTVRMKQDALRRLRRSDAQRLEATNRAELLAQQFERSSREVGRLQIELQRKDDEHQLEKQVVLQNSLAEILRNDAEHNAARAQIQQELNNVQNQKDAELRAQKDRFLRHIADIERRKNKEAEDLRTRNQAQEEEIRILRQNLRSEIHKQQKPVESSNRLQRPAVRAAAGSSEEPIAATAENAWTNSQHQARYKDLLERLCREVETLRHTQQNLESVLASSRQENAELQRAKAAVQTELEEKTRALEERTLALNRLRSELNEEKRKSRQALADNADKNKQFEFVQQQCARLQENLTQRRS